jgi:hypothetical protein
MAANAWSRRITVARELQLHALKLIEMLSVMEHGWVFSMVICVLSTAACFVMRVNTALSALTSLQVRSANGCAAAAAA